MSTPFLSEIALFSFNFPPKGWAQCNGQLLPINQNQALFSLLGTTYGGNGQTTFALPDLRSRVPLGFGQGPSGSTYTLGERAGTETVTLIQSQLPAHVHAIDANALSATAKCRSAVADLRSPVGALPAVEAGNVTAIYSNAATTANMRGGGVVVAPTSAVAGGSQPHVNLQPYLVLSFCIALQGIFPSPN